MSCSTHINYHDSSDYHNKEENKSCLLEDPRLCSLLTSSTNGCNTVISIVSVLARSGNPARREVLFRCPSRRWWISAMICSGMVSLISSSLSNKGCSNDVGKICTTCWLTGPQASGSGVKSPLFGNCMQPLHGLWTRQLCHPCLPSSPWGAIICMRKSPLAEVKR